MSVNFDRSMPLDEVKFVWGMTPPIPSRAIGVLADDIIIGNQHMARISRLPKLPTPQKALAAVGKEAAVALAGLAAYQVAYTDAPDALDRTAEYLEKSGSSLEQMLRDPAETTQAVIVELLIRNGMDPRLVLDVLPSVGKRAMAAMVKRVAKETEDKVDSLQVDVSPGADTMIDRVAKNLDIQAVCEGLNITSKTYELLLRAVNSHTSDDVQAFRLERSMYSLREI